MSELTKMNLIGNGVSAFIVATLLIISCSTNSGRYLSDLKILTPTEMELQWGEPEVYTSIFYDCREIESFRRCGEISDRGVEVIIYGWRMHQLKSGNYAWFKFEIELPLELQLSDGGEVFYYEANDTLERVGYILLIER